MNKTLVTACLSMAVMAVAASFSGREIYAADYTPAPENLASREAFREDRFGIFIHWGVYSMLATGEWTMTNRDLNYKEYAKLAGGFFPASFNAEEWVSAIKDAGAKYICFTTRHHDGFSMFDSGVTGYDIMDASPFRRDIVKELADECHRQGIEVHFYYSGRTGLGTGRPLDTVDKDSYYDFMKAQLTELLTNYGPVRAIWFDGHWDQDQNPDFDWRYDELYGLIHSLQAVRTYTFPAARLSRGQQSPSCSVLWRRHPDFRKGPARRKHRRPVRTGSQRRPAPGDLPDNERHVGIQDNRP